MHHLHEVDLILDPNAEMSVEMTDVMIEETVAEVVSVVMTAGQGRTIGLIEIIEIVLIAALIIGLDVDWNAVPNRRKRGRF